MSFFGFDQPNSLEDEKRRFLESGAQAAQQGDVAVYTWGEESYDGLGDALQEGGDELNDETFGVGEVGKDFDFSQQALPADDLPIAKEHGKARDPSPLRQEYRSQQQQQQAAQPSASSRPVDALWDNKSPFSLLPKANGGKSAFEHHHMPAPAPAHASSTSMKFSPFDAMSETATPGAMPNRQQQPMALSLGANQTHGVRTLEEIEAEMREAFAAQRLQNQSPQHHQQHYAQGTIRSSSAQRHIPPQYGVGGTPPPRMHPQHAQSPRFQQQQQQQIHLLQQQQQQMQLLELQELRDRQQRAELEHLQEQLRLEELERHRQQQLRAQVQQNAQMLHHQRQASGGTPIGEMPYRRQPVHPRATTPSRVQQPQGQHVDVSYQQNMQYLPREIQMQQRLLAEMAQAEFLHSLQGTPVPEGRNEQELHEILRAEAMRKIMEAERMEEKRKRKLEKIRYMSRYNDLMTQSDKDFITRIQVSQLVTQDPYNDDFYAQVYGALMRQKMGLEAPQALLRFGSGGGVGLGLHQIKGGGRRPSAMQRMEAQVERIVNNARMREKEKTSLNNLQGALGKTAGRSYKAAPRQLLQVDGPGTSPTISPAHAHISKADAKKAVDGEGVAKAAARIGAEALSGHDDQELVRRDPLSLKEALMVVERCIDILMALDGQRDHRPEEEGEALAAWEAEHNKLIDSLWDGLRVMVPLETSNPHPFISILMPLKGKKMLPRVQRYFDMSRNLTVLTLLVACFSQLDVVRDSYLIDRLEDSAARKEALIQWDSFYFLQTHYVLHVAGKCSLRIITGLLGLFLERNDVVAMAQTPAGLNMLTIFVSRASTLKYENIPEEERPTPSELTQWQQMFDHLFQLLAPHFLFLFPSVRQAVNANVPIMNIPDMDRIDQHTWQFFASMGSQSGTEQQQILVTSLRERVLDNVSSVAKGWVVDEETRRLRLANVNLFLRSLGLDSSQIAL